MTSLENVNKHVLDLKVLVGRSAPAETEVATRDSLPTSLKLATISEKPVETFAREVELAVDARPSTRTRLVPTPVV